MNKREIITSIVNNLYSFYREIGNTKVVNYGKTDIYEWISSKHESWPGIVFNLSNNGDQKEMLRTLKKDINANKIPPFLIIDDVNNKNIGYANLDELGFKPVRAWKGMHLKCDEIILLEKETALLVSIANSEKNIQDFVYLINNTLLKSNKVSEKVFLAVLRNPDFRFFNGYINSNIVSASLSFTRDKVAGLYMIATNNEHRGKGFGTKITVDAIMEQKNKGIRDVVLHATKTGEKIYSKLGFKVYCNHYIYWLLEK